MRKGLARSSRQTEKRHIEISLVELPWIPEDLARSLAVITSFLREAFGSEVSRIGLYGSWQSGDQTPASDVDIVVFLNHEVAWFDEEGGVVSRSEARKASCQWDDVERRATEQCADSRVYSISVVTPGMLRYYASQGPIHFQNWVYALRNCHTLWKPESSF
jgi:hypothetical protein